MNSISLIRTILGAARGNILPLAYVVDITAQRIFIQHIAEDDVKICSDVCVTAAKHLPGKPQGKAVMRQAARLANRCWDKMLKEGWVKEYIGKEISEIDGPRMMIIYLATFAYFDKPYFQMVDECAELFMGQLPNKSLLP